MSTLPAAIHDAIFELVLGDKPVAYLEVDFQGNLIAFGGEAGHYGMAAMTSGDAVEEHADFLSGVLDPDILPMDLPFMETPSGVTADVHLFLRDDRIWVLLMDAQEKEQKQQGIQQKVNSMSLRYHRQSRMLNQYLGKEVVERLEQGVETVEQAGERRELTIMFADIRGFTTFSEMCEPEDVFEALNAYLGAMIPPVLEEGGVLDKIIGDEIMVIFGMIPTEFSGPNQAVRAARRVLIDVAELNRVRESKGDALLRIGIGVATGPVSLGVLGSRHRKSITVIGNHVNLAARLQGQASADHLIIDADTYGALAGSRAEYEERNLTLKGYSGPLTAYQTNLERLLRDD